MTSEQVRDTLEQIDHLAERLGVLEADLRARAQDTPLDGYPRQSGPGASGHGHGDPVGAIVAIRVDHPHHDILATAHTTVVTKLDQARRLLEEAESTGRRALPPPTKHSLDDGCISCARIKSWSPISRTRRCRWCSDWASTHQGADPPVDILHAHHDGRRITTRLAETITNRRHP